eukprot:2684449-Prymnesium_polylepis.1
MAPESWLEWCGAHCSRPTSYPSCGQYREQSGVSTSSPSTSDAASLPATVPNSILVSATRMPRALAKVEANS